MVVSFTKITKTIYSNNFKFMAIIALLGSKLALAKSDIFGI